MAVGIVQIEGIQQALKNLSQLPRRVAFKHLRVALNAAGGTLKAAAIEAAPRETGTLRQSLVVKVKIPDASWNVEHHGKPAYTVIGPKRNATRAFQKIEGDFLKRHRQAQALLTKTRKSLKDQKLSATALERAAKSTVKEAFNRVIFRTPSRYAHLAEDHKSFLAVAASSQGPAASARAAQKLAAAFETEAAALPK